MDVHYITVWLSLLTSRTPVVHWWTLIARSSYWWCYESFFKQITDTRYYQLTGTNPRSFLMSRPGQTLQNLKQKSICGPIIDLWHINKLIQFIRTLSSGGSNFCLIRYQCQCHRFYKSHFWDLQTLSGRIPSLFLVSHSYTDVIKLSKNRTNLPKSDNFKILT